MALRVLLFLHLLLAASICTSSSSNARVIGTTKTLGFDSIVVDMRSEGLSVHYQFQGLRNNVSSKTSQRAIYNQDQWSMAEDESLFSSPTELERQAPSAISNSSHSLEIGIFPLQSLPNTSHQENASKQLTEIFKRPLAFILQALTQPSPIVLILSITWLYFSGSLFFDLAHFTLHKFSKSKSRILRNVGYLHEVHHLYFNRRLKFNDRYRLSNMLYELPLELSCQLFGTWVGYLLAHIIGFSGPTLLSKDIFVLVMVFEVVRSFVVACMEGRDSNHKSYDRVIPKDPYSFLVGPEYHALHHVDPASYLGSTVKVFDWVLGTSCSLRSRRVLMVGSLGAFGDQLREGLLREGVSCVEKLRAVPGEGDEGYRGMLELLSRTDILILAPGVDTGDVIQLFKTHHQAKGVQSLLLPEVWQRTADSSVGSTKQIRRSHDDVDILFRHIVCSRALLKSRPELVAKMAIWWVRRGVRSVPATFDFWVFRRVLVGSGRAGDWGS